MLISTGEGLMGKPIKTYNEHIEKKLWGIIMQRVNKETRLDGNQAYVIKRNRVGDLVIDIMEFYGEIQNKGFGKKKGI